MIDIHHHLLHALDDGPPDLATSVAMARMAAADGITHVVCTPHASGNFAFDPDLIASRLADLRAALAADRVPLTLGSACDFHLSYENIQDAIARPTRYSINGLGYILVELPDYGISPTLSETFYELQIAGLTVILTHPERNPTLQAESDTAKSARLADWLRAGVLVQITAGSVLGHMGKKAEQVAHKLLADRWVHFLATDAHNLTTRKPLLSEACALVSKKYTAAYADLLCTTNPRAAFEGRPLGPQIEPARLYEDPTDTRPWYKRIFPR